jgi:hypothetical protein
MSFGSTSLLIDWTATGLFPDLFDRLMRRLRPALKHLFDTRSPHGPRKDRVRSNPMRAKPGRLHRKILLATEKGKTPRVTHGE